MPVKFLLNEPKAPGKLWKQSVLVMVRRETSFSVFLYSVFSLCHFEAHRVLTACLPPLLHLH